MNITLRPAVAADRPFVFDTYFESQRPVIKQLFGWGGDNDFEAAKFDDFYFETATQIILVDDHEAGFLSLLRDGRNTNVQCLFLRPEYQGRGIGTQLLQAIIAESVADGTRLTVGTERINRAQQLYLRLGFVVIRETKYRLEFVYPKKAEP